MTEELEINDFEYSNEYDGLEEEVDKLNDLTFGDEIAWKYESLNPEKDDSSFERFPFDEFEIMDKKENDSTDLLGLKGSFFNFGLFKPPCKGDEDFKVAMGKLDSLILNEKHCEVTIESPLSELNKYSETLFQAFQDSKKYNNNSQSLNGVVSKHLNLLSKKLTQLSLPMDVLAQLRYFRVLTTFVSVDNRVNEIRTKCAADSSCYNAEIASLWQHFAAQSAEQQMELCAIHPFYNELMACVRAEQNRSLSQPLLATMNPAPIHSLSHAAEVPLLPLRSWCTVADKYKPQSAKEVLDEGGWVTSSERSWLTKVQTRNLVSDNPYLHDYYYTAVKYRELMAARDAQLAALGHTNIPDPISLLPSPITADQLGAGIDPTKDGVTLPYSPVQFENSLGLLTSANLNTPRPTISVPRRHRVTLGNSWDCVNDPYRPVRVQRELLGFIETLHCTVLRVDEVDKSMAKMLVAQHPNRGVLLHHRTYLLNTLMDYVNNNVRFVQLFSVAKGARILTSVMAIVTSVQFLQLMRTFFFNCLSVWESDCFRLFESDFRSIIVSRVQALHKEELSLLITTLFCNLTPKSINDRVKLQPLSGFCRSEFGIHVVFTVLDTFFKMSPDDKTNIFQLVEVAIKSSDSKTAIHKVVNDFHVLLPAISGHK